MDVIEELRRIFSDIAGQYDLMSEKVHVTVKPISVRQAIGTPERDDFPIQKGKERIIEATFKQSRGQAFTDAFCDFNDNIAGLLRLDLNDPFNRSVFTASVNAVLLHLGMVKGTVHCRDKEPTQCAPKLLGYLREHYPETRRVALVGLQPAMAEVLAEAYDLNIVDLDPDNIGRKTADITIRDGKTDLTEVIHESDVVVATGSTLSNNTMDAVRKASGARPLIFFGITVSGAASLLNLERFCPFGH